MKWLAVLRSRFISRKAAARRQATGRWRFLHFRIQGSTISAELQYEHHQFRVPDFPRNTVENITKEGAPLMKTLLRSCLFALALSGLVAGIFPKTSTATRIPGVPTLPSCPQPPTAR